MVGLPKSLKVDGVSYDIRTDYRVVLNIFEAYNDPELTEQEKALVMLKCLYITLPSNLQGALEQAVWFLDGGSPNRDGESSKGKSIKVIDWVQDEQLIFAAVNKVAGCELRAVDYCHWFTFLAYFNSVEEGLLTTVINIRTKKAKGKKLEKYEQDFYREHKDLIDIRKQYTAEEKEEMARLNEIFK